MTRNSEYTLILFYSRTNQQSVNARIVVNEFMIENFGSVDITVTETEYESDKRKATEYGVSGTPAIVILKDGHPIRRHLGEITSDELVAMVKKLRT